MGILHKMFECGGAWGCIFTDDVSGVFLGNTTCATHRGELIANVRGLDYYYPTQFGTISNTLSSSHIGRLNDCRLNVINSNYESGDYAYFDTYRGREDIRLMDWGDTLYGICSRPDVVEGGILMELLEYDNNFNPKHLQLIHSRQRVEKNWAPIEGRPMSFIYNISQGVVVEVTPDGGVYYEGAIRPAEGSGGTQFIKCKYGYIGIVHRHKPWPNYEHSFVIYSEDMQSVTQTEWFKFTNYPVEFASGLCIHNNRLIITLSLMDSIPIVCSFDISAIDAIMGQPYEKSNPPQMWMPSYIGDNHQNLSYQLFLGNTDNYMQTLKDLGLYNVYAINKLKFYGILN